MECLLDPDSIIDVIMSTMKKPALESFLKSCDVSAALLPAVRDWQAWHNDLRLTISGALLVDATAMHFFFLTDRESRNQRPMLEHGSAECLLSKTSGKFYQTQSSQHQPRFRDCVGHGGGAAAWPCRCCPARCPVRGQAVHL
jgi:hypothetical protein